MRFSHLSHARKGALAAGAGGAVASVVFLAVLFAPLPGGVTQGVFDVALVPLFPVAVTAFGVGMAYDPAQWTAVDAFDAGVFIILSIILTAGGYAAIGGAAGWLWGRLRSRR